MTKWQRKLLLFIPFGLLLSNQIGQIQPKPLNRLLVMGIDNSTILTVSPQIEPFLSDFAFKEMPIPDELKQLAKCESGLNPQAVNWNDHGSPSYGLFQWKEDSFWRYNEKYKVLPNLERAEVRNVIMDQTAPH